MSNNTVRLHRVLRTRPEKIYRAFLDPDATVQAREGVTGTVRRGLEILAAADAYEKLARLRGRVKFSTTLATMIRLDHARTSRGTPGAGRRNNHPL